MDDGLKSKPLVEYPCIYTFKAIGLKGQSFPDHVRRLVASVTGPIAPDSCRVRESAHGKYESVTVHVQLFNEDMRRAVYQALFSDERVVFYL